MPCQDTFSAAVASYSCSGAMLMLTGLHTLGMPLP
jgi:hypothetical protein